jgi:DeoR family transcriptional regulator, suf operon transcriptional repressor
MTNVTMPKTNSRQKILNYLRRQMVATATEISKALRVTPANIRHHLSRLLLDGLVEVSGLRLEGARGRPHKIYSLSRLAIGDNLSALSSVLLAEFVDNLPVDEQAARLHRLVDGLFPNLPPERAGHITRRLAATVEALNLMRYHARWEAHAAGPRLILEQCPYATIIADHPALCSMDKLLIERTLSQRVEQLAKLERNERGVPVCLFALE